MIAARRGRAGLRWRSSSDEGFTIIELVAALGILAVGVAALVPVFWTGLTVAGATAHRTDAQALATRETEGMHAVPYAQVGMYSGQIASPVGTCAPTGTPTPSAPCEPSSPDPGFPVVVLGGPTPATPQVVPVSTVPVGPLTYTVTRYVEWADAPSSGVPYSKAYKRTSVIVSWTDKSGTHAAREDSILYPGGIGPFTTVTTAPSGGTAPSAPTITGATAPNPSEVDVTWSQSTGTVTSYDLEYSTDPGFSVFAAKSGIPSSAQSQQMTTLSSATYYYFRLVAFGTGGTSSTSSVVGPVGTPAAGGGRCNVNSVVVTGASSASSTGTILQPSGDMSESLYLTVNTNGVPDCTSRTFSVKATDRFGRGDPGSPWPVSGGPPSYTAIVPSLNQSGWSTGTHTFTVLDAGSPLNPTVVQSFNVCTFGSTSC